MYPVLILVLYIAFGGFIFFLGMICSLRCYAYIRDEDYKFLCFRNKPSERNRASLAFRSEMSSNPMPPDANPDEDINESRICSPYIYEDGCTTGLRTLAYLPISIINNGISSCSMSNGCQSVGNFFPRTSMGYNFCNTVEVDDTSAENWAECPPPDYYESVENSKLDDDCKIDIDSEESELQPPSYEDYLKSVTESESAHHM